MMSLIGQDKYACTISYEKRERFIHWLCRQDLNQEMLISAVKSTPSPLQLTTPIKIAKSRVTFDPEGEISKLEDWFDKNQRPNKEMIMEYTEELNKGRLGKSKRMLLQESIAVWFKNRRAKAKKDESAADDHIVTSHKMWEVEEQAGNEMPTMVLLRVSMENKEETNEGDCGQGSDLVNSETVFTTAETNSEEISEEIATVMTPEGTSIDSNTSPVLLNNKQTFQDQNDVNTTNNEADTTNSLINDEKKTSNQQMTTGNQGLEKGDRLETGGQSVKTKEEREDYKVIENVDKASADPGLAAVETKEKSDDHQVIEDTCTSKTNADHMVVTVSAKKLGSEVKDINGRENACAVSFVKSEESDSASSLKRTREEADQKILDHDKMQHNSSEMENSLAPKVKQQCL